MKLVRYANLKDNQKAQVKRAFVHWHLDPTSSSFDEWAHKHSFYFTQAGNLSMRHNYCEPACLAPEKGN